MGKKQTNLKILCGLPKDVEQEYMDLALVYEIIATVSKTNVVDKQIVVTMFVWYLKGK